MNRSLADLLKIVGLVTLFALIISCLGIFAMALNNTQARLKEIRINPGIFTFAFGVCLFPGMTAAIVIPIVLRAARVNPVKILRYE